MAKSSFKGSIPKDWQRKYDDTWRSKPSSDYDHGAAKTAPRSTPIGPGGTGAIVSRTRESSLGKRG